MAKKKKEQVAVSDQPDLDTPLSTTATRPAEEVGYTVGLWAWKDQYRCKQCDFDTLNLDVMLEHLLSVHAVFQLKEPRLTLPSPQPSPEGRGGDVEKADGIFEIDLKEDQ